MPIGFDILVVALGAVSRTAPIPGLLEHAVGFKSVAEAIYLRNHVLTPARAGRDGTRDEAERRRRLTFVFVGGGYAGVEAMAELEDLCRDASRHYPELAPVPRRWLLVDAADHILPELGGGLAAYATGQLERRGFELHLGSGLQAVSDQGVELADGTIVPTATVVWTAGVRPQPLAAELGLPLDERGRVPVDEYLRVPGHPGVWALGDVAAVPNAATPRRPDPPTCQHALRQARRLARNLLAEAGGRPLGPYRYRMLGQVATLGRHKGVAELFGRIRLRGFAGWWFTRTYHLYQLPLREPQAARRHRLDGRPVLPPRRRRAGIAGTAGAARSATGAALTPRPAEAARTAARITATPAICQADGDSPRMMAPKMTVATGCSVSVMAVSAAGSRVSDTVIRSQPSTCEVRASRSSHPVARHPGVRSRSPRAAPATRHVDGAGRRGIAERRGRPRSRPLWRRSSRYPV